MREIFVEQYAVPDDKIVSLDPYRCAWVPGPYFFSGTFCGLEMQASLGVHGEGWGRGNGEGRRGSEVGEVEGKEGEAARGSRGMQECEVKFSKLISPERQVVTPCNHSNNSQFHELYSGKGFEAVGQRVIKLGFLVRNLDESDREGALASQEYCVKICEQFVQK